MTVQTRRSRQSCGPGSSWIRCAARGISKHGWSAYFINECSTILRRQQRLAPYDAAAAEAIPTPAADDYSDLYAAITALEEKLRLPVELYYLEGFKTREIAGMLRHTGKHGQDPSPSGKRAFAQGLERSVLRMMNHNDFPKMTEEFDRSVRRALDSLPERESKPVRRFSAKKIRLRWTGCCAVHRRNCICRECTELVSAAVSEWRRRESRRVCADGGQRQVDRRERALPSVGGVRAV